MCRQVITDNQLNDELEFFVYNLVFDKKNGKFTVESVHQQLAEVNIQVQENFLENLFSRWLDNGLIFNNVFNYVINKSYY